MVVDILIAGGVALKKTQTKSTVCKIYIPSDKIFIILDSICCKNINVDENGNAINSCSHVLLKNNILYIWELKKIKKYLSEATNVPDHFVDDINIRCKNEKDIRAFPYIKKQLLEIKMQCIDVCVYSYDRSHILTIGNYKKIVSFMDICKYFVINSFKKDDVPPSLRNFYVKVSGWWRPEFYKNPFYAINENSSWSEVSESESIYAELNTNEKQTRITPKYIQLSTIHIF